MYWQGRYKFSMRGPSFSLHKMIQQHIIKSNCIGFLQCIKYLTFYDSSNVAFHAHPRQAHPRRASPCVHAHAMHAHATEAHVMHAHTTPTPHPHYARPGRALYILCRINNDMPTVDIGQKPV
jgi:hypothetical protein